MGKRDENASYKMTKLYRTGLKFKPEKKFVELFNQYFKEDFDLYTRLDVIDSKLFGDGDANSIFSSALGDFLAIAKTNKTINYHKKDVKKSHHAGYTDDEIYVPLIVVKK